MLREASDEDGPWRSKHAHQSGRRSNAIARRGGSNDAWRRPRQRLGDVNDHILVENIRNGVAAKLRAHALGAGRDQDDREQQHEHAGYHAGSLVQARRKRTKPRGMNVVATASR